MRIYFYNEEDWSPEDERLHTRYERDIVRPGYLVSYRDWYNERKGLAISEAISKVAKGLDPSLTSVGLRIIKMHKGDDVVYRCFRGPYKAGEAGARSLMELWAGSKGAMDMLRFNPDWAITSIYDQDGALVLEGKSWKEPGQVGLLQVRQCSLDDAYRIVALKKGMPATFDQIKSEIWDSLQDPQVAHKLGLDPASRRRQG